MLQVMVLGVNKGGSHCVTYTKLSYGTKHLCVPVSVCDDRTVGVTCKTAERATGITSS
jgi:hypothetical protein